jgi:DNA-directed RNA polymerase subunit RPC12/RpoP
MALTEEEQRYATAWAKLRGQEKFARWVMGALVLAMVSLLLAPKSLSESFGIVFLVFAVVAGLGGHYITVTFKCPRCQRQFSRMRYQHKTNCYNCGLPRFAPRNPDPNWKPG